MYMKKEEPEDFKVEGVGESHLQKRSGVAYE